jgi:phosphoglycolate phosphatase
MSARTSQLIIFDFDGTLVDTLEIMVKIVNRLAPEFGYQPLDVDRVSNLKYLTPWEVIKLLQVSLWKLPFILRRVKQEFKTEVGNVRLFPGILELLQSLRSNNYRLGIVSSNAEGNIRSLLRLYGIEHLFEFVITASTFGKGRAIAKVMRQDGLDRSDVIYIGDEIRDIQAAKSIGIRVVAVSWGFNEPTTLIHQQPDLLITKPQALLKALDVFYPPLLVLAPIRT